MNAFSSAVVFAAAYEPARQSILSWMFQSLGIMYGTAIPLSGLVVFLGACLVVALSRRPAVIAAYLVFLPLPLLIGVLGSVHGLIASHSVIAMSDVAPEPAAVAAGISTALFSTLAGMIVSFPSYFVLSIGLFLRTLLSPSTDVQRRE